MIKSSNSRQGQPYSRSVVAVLVATVFTYGCGAGAADQSTQSFQTALATTSVDEIVVSSDQLVLAEASSAATVQPIEPVAEVLAPVIETDSVFSTEQFDSEVVAFVDNGDSVSSPADVNPFAVSSELELGQALPEEPTAAVQVAVDAPVAIEAQPILIEAEPEATSFEAEIESADLLPSSSSCVDNDGDGWGLDGMELCRSGGDIAFFDQSLTDDQAQMELALSYEGVFYSRINEYREHVLSQFDRYTNQEAWDQSYGGIIGISAYHLYDELYSLAWMLTVAQDDSHRDAYAELAKEVLNKLVYGIANGESTSGCVPEKDTMFYCRPGEHRYLDVSRANGGAGMIMLALQRDNRLRSVYASEMNDWSTALEPILDNLKGKSIVVGASGARTPHMSANIGPGFLAVGNQLARPDFIDTFYSIAGIMQTNMESDESQYQGWVGHDVSHARTSMVLIHLAYRERLRGDSNVEIDYDHMQGIGTRFVEESTKSVAAHVHGPVKAFVGKILGAWGTTVQFSPDVSNRSIAATDYAVEGAPGNHDYARIAESLAALAMGHATKK